MHYDTQKNNKNTLLIIIFSTIILALICGISAYLLQTHKIMNINRNKIMSSQENNNSQTSNNALDKLLYYTEKGEYSIQYPSSWKKEGGGGNGGYELISLIKKSKDSNDAEGSLEDTSKITIHILDSHNRTIEQIVSEIYSQNIGRYDMQKLIIDGKESVRVNGVIKFGDEEISTVCDCIIDYKNNKYISIVGYYNSGEDLLEIKNIQESFKLM